MADNGGHSGFLRDELGVLPPGDVRNCLVALADEKKQKILRELLNFRIHYKKSGLKENVGNIILTALSQIYNDFAKAVNILEELLEIKGRVIPVTLEKTHLVAKLENGEVVFGENNIDTPKNREKPLKIKKVWLKPTAQANPQAIKAILEAEGIILGPGDLYTSIIPNLIVKGIKNAIAKSKAKVIYIVNLMTKAGETDNFKAIDFVKVIEKFLPPKRLNAVIINTSRFPKKILALYQKQKSVPVKFDQTDFIGSYYSVYSANVASWRANLIRHHPDKLARLILSIILTP
mgnify:CR=1 FL=1